MATPYKEPKEVIMAEEEKVLFTTEQEWQRIREILGDEIGSLWKRSYYKAAKDLGKLLEDIDDFEEEWKEEVL